MKWIMQLLAAMLLWIFIACNNKQKEITSMDINSSDKKGKAEELIRDMQSADSVASPQGNTPQHLVQATGKSQAKEDWDKKIVKTGELSVEVKDYVNFNTILHAAVKRYGGYIAQEEQNQSSFKIENIITIKVPVEQFDDAITALTPGTEKVIEKKISAEDVTGELVDTKSRMEAKKRVRNRYLDMLKQAKNMEEILQVQNEVNSIQENIEAAAGRIGYLDHAAAFSTIHIGFYQVLTQPGSNEINPSYSYRIMESLRSGWHWFLELLVIIASCWPVLIAAGAAWLFVRKRKLTTIKKAKPIS